MPYWNFEYTRAVISTVENVGGGIGQDPATEVTHVGLNQPPVFSSVESSVPPVSVTSHASSSPTLHDNLWYAMNDQ